MKKSAFLLAGVAVLALSANAASAQTLGGFTKGQYTNTSTGFFTGFVIPGTTVNVPAANATPLQAAGQVLTNIALSNNSAAEDSAWHAVGLSVGNIGGNGDGSDGATFSLSGDVSEDCAFYTGTSNALSFDFGQIGVYVSDNTGPAAAFTMVAPATMNFDTNLAGCNTPNQITITKSNALGLTNTAGGGYDTNVFQANLPYKIDAKYTAAAGTASGQGTLKTLSVAVGAPSNSVSHGAWKSNMDLEVTIPQADKALLAGNYSGNFTVLIAAN